MDYTACKYQTQLQRHEEFEFCAQQEQDSWLYHLQNCSEITKISPISDFDYNPLQRAHKSFKRFILWANDLPSQDYLAVFYMKNKEICKVRVFCRRHKTQQKRAA